MEDLLVFFRSRRAKAISAFISSSDISGVPFLWASSLISFIARTASYAMYSRLGGESLKGSALLDHLGKEHPDCGGQIEAHLLENADSFGAQLFFNARPQQGGDSVPLR
jgi:hypothetical protein